MVEKSGWYTADSSILTTSYYSKNQSGQLVQKIANCKCVQLQKPSTTLKNCPQLDLNYVQQLLFIESDLWVQPAPRYDRGPIMSGSARWIGHIGI